MPGRLPDPPASRPPPSALGEHSALIDQLTRALAPELPLLTRDGGFIAAGYALQLDDLVTLRDESRRLIAAMQARYADLAGVSGLKIRHNNVLGYYIEVTPTHADKLMTGKAAETFIHRQTLASAVRFTTVELNELERKIAEAADKALAVELTLFDELVTDVTAPRRCDLRGGAGAGAARRRDRAGANWRKSAATAGRWWTTAWNSTSGPDAIPWWRRCSPLPKARASSPTTAIWRPMTGYGC